MLFKSNLTYIKDLHFKIHPKEIPQLYRADFKFARENSNSISFNKLLLELRKLTYNDGFKYTSIDTRTHMLMKGMYPCIPGWHCDDFYRPNEDQPDLLNVEKDAPQKHYLIVLGDCSMTEFTIENMDLKSPLDLPKDNPIYYYYDQMLEENKNVKTKFVEQNKIYSFGPTAFHRGSPATENGFRSFIRVTRSNHRKPKNEIRYQSNVYLAGRTSW